MPGREDQECPWWRAGESRFRVIPVAILLGLKLAQSAVHFGRVKERSAEVSCKPYKALWEINSTSADKDLYETQYSELRATTFATSQRAFRHSHFHFGHF